MAKIDKKEIGISVIKSALGAAPYVGTLLNEIVFNYRSRIKEKRLLEFVKQLEQSIAELQDNDINYEYLKSDEFSDILEEIFKKISTTSSSEKSARFKKILIGEMTATLHTDHKLTFLDITNSITEKQIEILKEHSTIGKSIGKYYKDIELLNNQIPDLIKTISNEKSIASRGYKNDPILFEKRLKLMTREVNRKMKGVKQAEPKRYGKHYNVSQDQYNLLVQDLISKGLLVDIGIGITNLNPFQIVEVTSFGKEYLKYLME